MFYLILLIFDFQVSNVSTNLLLIGFSNLIIMLFAQIAVSFNFMRKLLPLTLSFYL